MITLTEEFKTYAWTFPDNAVQVDRNKRMLEATRKRQDLVLCIYFIITSQNDTKVGSDF